MLLHTVCGGLFVYPGLLHVKIAPEASPTPLLKSTPLAGCIPPSHCWCHPCWGGGGV